MLNRRSAKDRMTRSHFTPPPGRCWYFALRTFERSWQSSIGTTKKNRIPGQISARASRTCCSVQPAIACASPMRFNCSTTASTRGLGAATTTTAHRRDDERRQHDCVVLPSPAAARAAAERTLARRPPHRPQSRHTCVRQGAARGKRRSCDSTDATDAPNRQARRSTHNSALNTRAIDATFP